MPDPAHTPSSNGCGPECIPVDDNPTGCDDTSFLDACNGHDICYDTCGNDRWTCDQQFYSDMLAVCNQSQCTFDCYDDAFNYYKGVRNLGLIPYRSAQVNACACCDCF